MQNGLSVQSKVGGSIRLVDKSDNPSIVDVAINEAKKAEPIPVGAIVMYKGNLDDLPVGWKLCDGSTGTPNLLGKFVYGANQGNNVNGGGAAPKEGGYLESQIPEHTHTTTNTTSVGHTHTVSFGSVTTESVGAHTHDTRKSPNDGVRVASHQDKGHKYTYGNRKLSTSTSRLHKSKNPDHAHNYTFDAMTSEKSGDHTHKATVEKTKASKPGGNLPPYYELAYIIKVK